MSTVSKICAEAHLLASQNIGEVFLNFQAYFEAVDDAIKQMSSLIVKCEEISDNMAPIEQLVIQMCVKQGIQTFFDFQEKP
jgi:hypothetical protein